MSDEFVEEIHVVRRQIAEECDHDLEKIGVYFMELQKRFPDRLIRQVAQAEPETANTRE
jgi:hypothetical protein